MKPLSFNFVAFFGPNHYFNKIWEEDGFESKTSWLDYWFYRPDEDSTGGIGFKLRIPSIKCGIHISFHWIT